jgi:hypothetical protein
MDGKLFRVGHQGIKLIIHLNMTPHFLMNKRGSQVAA